MVAAGNVPKEQVLYSADYPPETKVEVRTLRDGRVRLIVRGKPQQKT